MTILIGKVHGWTEVIKLINNIPHLPEVGKKNKVKWIPTVVTPERLETFKETESEEEALKQKLNDNNEILVSRNII